MIIEVSVVESGFLFDYMIVKIMMCVELSELFVSGEMVCFCVGWEYQINDV